MGSAGFLFLFRGGWNPVVGRCCGGLKFGLSGVELMLDSYLLLAYFGCWGEAGTM
jgi:hypothetical protein